MRIASLIAAAAVIAAPAAIASKPKKPIDPNKKICRQESTIGSIGTHSTCHTYAEWQAIDAASAGQSRGPSSGQPNPPGTTFGMPGSGRP